MAKKPRSGGPRTEAGKARSSQNARKHGLLTEKIFILQTEDPAEWQKLQDTWIAKLEPKDDLELLAVNRIAFAQWRMHRLWAMETAAIDKEMDDQAPAFDARYGADADPFLRGMLAFEAFAAKENGAGLMHRYQGHLERCYARAFESFMDLRTKTKLLNELEVAAGHAEDTVAAEVTPSADVAPRQHEHGAEQNAEKRNEPEMIEQKERVLEIPKRTEPESLATWPTAAFEAGVSPHQASAVDDNHSKAGLSSEKAA
jgi:hypothetical protein